MKIRRSILTIVVIQIIMTSLATTVAAEHPWPMFRHDLQHSGRTPFTGPAAPTVQWNFESTGGIVSSAAVAEDGTLYVGAGGFFFGVADSNLYAINPDGSLKWSYTAGGGLFSSPAIGPDGTIYIGCLDNHLYAVEDALTHGNLKWKTDLGFIVYSSPAVGADGTIYLGSLNFNLHAVNPDGTYKWGYLAESCFFSSPAIGPQGEIYVGSKDHNLYCLEDALDHGEQRWSYAAGEFIDGHFVDSSPALGPDGTVYVGADPYGGVIDEMTPVPDNFFALSSTGELKWSLTFGDGVESSPARGSDGTIYVGSFDHNLYAIRDQGDAGTVAWQFPTGGWIDGSPVVDGCGTIYVGSRDSTLYAINPDGSLRWSFPAGGAIEASPSIGADGILYFGTMAGVFYALGSPGPDVGVANLDIPEQVEVNATYVPGCTVGNFRSGVQNFEVTCSIATGGVLIYRNTIAITSLAGGTTQPVAFAPWTAGPESGVVFNITLASDLAGDNNAFNDTITTQVQAVDMISGVRDEGIASPDSRIRLHGNFPNPFNPQTTIEFEMPSREAVTLRVFDMSGRLVKELAGAEELHPGRHEVVWNGRDDAGRQVASGTYFYRLEAGRYSETKRMVLVK